MTRLLELKELWSGEMIGCDVAGRKVLVLRLGDDVFAYEDRCAHLGVRLSEGTLDGEVLTCRAHHYQYDARTGRGINPRTASVPSLPVKIDAGVVYLDAP